MSITGTALSTASSLADSNLLSARSSSTSSSSSSDSTSSSSSSGLATKNMFLKLLVQQIKCQDPLNPTDSTEFVSQLAQFTELEQVMSISSDMSTLLSDLTGSST
jgi:flagellar basal-body rod modification protein FlgD